MRISDWSSDVCSSDLSIEYAANVVLAGIGAGKHIVQMNAELDGPLGPILKMKADRAGVIYSFSDGDQPGVQMNLYRFVAGLCVTPRLCGNIKGDRKSGDKGKGVSVRVDLGLRRIFKKKK